MEDPADLAGRIRKRIGNAALPRDSHTRYYAGAGDGQSCACCDQPIRDYGVQYDVEDPVRVHFVAMHRNCFQVWRQVANTFEHPVLQLIDPIAIIFD
jgi:hypothetical protein